MWSPLPPSPSGIADYVAEALPALAARAEVAAVVPDPAAVAGDLRGAVSVLSAAEADRHGRALDVYHLGNSPEHAFVYRRAVAVPGVAVLHEWVLHDLVRHVTAGQGDVAGYLRELRRAHGEAGAFVGRQVARGLGGEMLPSLFPLVDRVLERSLGVVALTRCVSDRAAARAPGRPTFHLPHHFALPFPDAPGPAEARARIGMPAGAWLVVAPGLATGAKGLRSAVRAVARLRAEVPAARLVVAGGVDPDLPLADFAREAGLGEGLVVTGRLELGAFVLHIAAADVVLALRFPSRGEMSGALVRALGLGRPALVTAGSAAAGEFPEGVVAPVDPAREEDEVYALLRHLHGAPQTRRRMGELAHAYVAEFHGLERTVEALLDFLRDVAARRGTLEASLAADAEDERSPCGFALAEVRGAARELGLVGLRTGAEPLVRALLEKAP